MLCTNLGELYYIYKLNMRTLKIKDWKQQQENTHAFIILKKDFGIILRVMRFKDKSIFYRGGFYSLKGESILVEIDSFLEDFTHVFVKTSETEVMLIHIESLNA